MALTMQNTVPATNDESTSSIESFSKEINVETSSTKGTQQTTTKSLMLAIQFGILHSMAKISPKPKRDLLITDFLTADNIPFPHQGSEYTPAHKYSDFTFKSYSPVAFRHLRDHFDIQPEDFIASVCYNPLKQLGNPGASGSVFYLTQDDKYIIKTVSYKEALFLQKLLAGYWINLLQNSHTLLPKFYGLYSYQSGNRKTRFVIMNNLLPSTIQYQYRFDLKGSTYGRRASMKEKRKSSPTFKDLDFLQMFPTGLSLSSEMHDKLVNTLRRDCTVLESFDIMDYSLLLAVHNVSEDYRQNKGMYDIPVETHVVDTNTSTMITISHSENADFDIICEPATPIEPESPILSTFMERIPEGDVIATLPNGDTVVLYVGIIDILQNYRAKKKLEHAMKSIVTKGDTVSVHNPAFYSARFKNFMSTVIFRSPETPNQTKPLKRLTSFNAVSELMLLNIGRDNSDLRWTPPPDYTRAKSAADIYKINRGESDDDSVFTEEGDPIRYSNLDLNRFTPDQRATSSPSQTRSSNLRIPTTQTDL